MDTSLRSLVTLAGLGTALAAGCAADNGEDAKLDTGALDAVEAADTVVIEKDATDVAKVFEDRVELPRVSSETRSRLQVGSVIVGRRGSLADNPHGFLRKVKAIGTRADGLVLTTSPATLGEAIQQGEVSEQTGPIDPYSPQGSGDASTIKPKADHDGDSTPGRFSHTFDPQSIISSPNFEARLEKTTTSCTPTFDTALRMRGFRLETLRFVMDDVLTIQTELSATARGRFERSVTIPLFKNKIFLPPQQIGPIPVVETVDVSVDLACDFSADGSVTARAGLRADLGYRFGIEYANGDWRMIANAGEIALAAVGPTIEAQANTRLDCRIVPRVALLFYDVVGPYLSVTPRIVATASAQATPEAPPTGEWSLTGSLRAEAGLTGTINVPGVPSLSSLINNGIGRSQLELFKYEKQWSGAL